MIRIALGLILCATAMPAAAAEKPNVVVVLFDDLGYGEPTCYRPESKLKTPRLDGLAAGGMRFTDAHSASAVCTPATSRPSSSRIGWSRMSGTWRTSRG